MPTLFDSHEEFTEWFSKDIESHVEKQSGLDESNYVHHGRKLVSDIQLKCCLLFRIISVEECL